MYKLEFLPVAKKDMIDIVRYISLELKNPDAANRLAEDLIDSAEGVLKFPYSSKAYKPIRSLKHEYRMIQVRNYLMFYRIDEDTKTVIISRVVYAKRDYNRLLE